MKLIEFLTGKLEDGWGGWSRKCRVNGTEYVTSVKRGKSVRIPYKPRGKNRGYEWIGTVYSNCKCIWTDKVPGSIGVRGLLIEAGVFDGAEFDEYFKSEVSITRK